MNYAKHIVRICTLLMVCTLWIKPSDGSKWTNPYDSSEEEREPSRIDTQDHLKRCMTEYTFEQCNQQFAQRAQDDRRKAVIGTTLIGGLIAGGYWLFSWLRTPTPPDTKTPENSAEKSEKPVETKESSQ